MDLFASLHRRTLAFLGRLTAAGVLSPGIDLGRSTVRPPPAGSHHDLVIDAALVHARDVLATDEGAAWLARILVAEAAAWPEVEAAEVAGRGLIGVALSPAARFAAVAGFLRDGRGGGMETPAASRRSHLAGTASLGEARSAALADVASRLAATAAADGGPRAGAPLPPRCGPVVVARGGGIAGAPTLADVAAVVGHDAFRVAAVSRRPDALLRLDLDALRERARSNAAFWLPYVHARSRALLRRIVLASPDLVPSRLARADPGAATSPDDLALVRLLLRHGHVISEAATAGMPHLFLTHLHALAEGIHRQWSGSKDQPQLRFVNEQRRCSTEARLASVTASTLVLETGLGILGVAAPEEMP